MSDDKPTFGSIVEQFKQCQTNKRAREEDNETTCLSDNEDAWQRRRTKKTEKFLNGYDKGELKAALMESHYMSSVLINRRRDIENYMKKYEASIPNYEEELKAKEDELKINAGMIEGLEKDVDDLQQELRRTKDVFNSLLRDLVILNNNMSRDCVNYRCLASDKWKVHVGLLKEVIDKYVDYDKLIKELN